MLSDKSLGEFSDPTMPLTQYMGSFDAERMTVLQAAFDMAWSDVTEALPELRIDEQTARTLIAKRIVEAALRGECDVNELRRYALEGLS